MSAVHTTIEIAAAPHAVWEVAMNPERLGEWVTIHRRLEAHTATSMEQVLTVRGVTFHVEWNLETSDCPHHAVWSGRGPAHARAEIEYHLTAVPGGTRFEYRNEFKAPLGPFGAFASRALMGAISQREAEASLLRLKKLCESA